jgi:hypothetical protein
VQVGPTAHDASAFTHAFAAHATPLDVQHIANARAREIYAADLVLVRPDLHVVWRGNAMPADTDRIAATVTGHRALVRASALLA